MTDLLPHIETLYSPSNAAVDASVIWLHGLGADGHDFEPIVPELNLPQDYAVRFVFPHAPVRPVTINMGMEMRSWYDIISMTSSRQVDETQLQDSCRQLRDFIDHEIARGIDSRRIVVAGFSQGGAVAMTTAFCYEKPLAGIMALSTYLPMPDWIAQHRTPANNELPVFMAHGTEDPVVPYSLAQQAKQHLVEFGYKSEWHEYPMPHAVCPPEISDISHWLQQRLAR